MSVIGIVRLAPGQVGYFDDLTRIHLTIASPEKPVVSGMNTTNLKRAVKSGRVLLSSGSLDVVEKIQEQVPVQIKEVKEIKPEVQVQAPVIEDEVKEESGVVTIDTEAALEKIQEEKEVEPIVEEQPVVENNITEPAAEEVAAVNDAVEATEEVKTEVVEESKPEETEVKPAVKKTNSNKKK